MQGVTFLGMAGFLGEGVGGFQSLGNVIELRKVTDVVCVGSGSWCVVSDDGECCF